MNKTIAAIILIVLILIGAYFMIKGSQQTPVVTPPPSSTPALVTYFCKEGTIIAKYGQADVSLGLSDGRTLDLPQVMSGSGIRYEKGTVSFSSKGDTAFLEESGITSFSNCISGIQTSSKDTDTFTDTSKTFTFNYPNTLTLSGGEMGYTQSWAQSSSDNGLILAMVTIPGSTQPKTNFSEAKFQVGTSSDPDAITNCLVPQNGATVADTPVMINGLAFTKLTMGDAGAGNFYETTSYRTLRSGQCYAVEYTVHTTNIGNYSPDQHILPYDKAKVDATLEGIVQSFKFI